MRTTRHFIRGAAALALLATVAASPAAFSAPRIAAGERIDVYAQHSEAAFGAIRAGMTSAQVAERLGAPDHRMRFDRTRTTAWDYDYRDTWGYLAQFSVVIDDSGRVVDTVVTRQDA